MNIAIVGATGLVGKKIIEILQERNIYADNFYLFASEEEVNKNIKIFDRFYAIQKLDLDKLDSLKIDYAFFASDTEISKKLVPIFAKKKITVIDNSNAFRRYKNVPLVVPQVNFNALKKGKYIFSNPNCSTIQLVTVLKPLDKKFKIKRVIVSTYQAVSGAGKDALLDLQNNTTNKFEFPINSNLIPHIDEFLVNGYTKEEDKLMFESQKILESSFNISATAVRVPIKNCHSECVNVEFEKPTSLCKIYKELNLAENVVILDDTSKHIYPMPLLCDGKDEVFVGRIRKDFSTKNAFNFFIVADNLRRGAASNAVDIFQSLIKLRRQF